MERATHNFGTSLEEYFRTGNYDNASKLIVYINTQLVDNIGMSTLNYMISNIFDESYSLLRFLTSIANRKEWKTALSNGLALLDNLLKNFLNTLKPYILEISKTCNNIVMSKASAHEKGKALEILCLILNNDCDIALDEVTNIYNKYFNFIRVHQSTTPTTVQKNVFILLGIILKKYPFLISNQAELIEIMVRQLRRQSEMPEKKSDKNIVSGCIDGLSHILDKFPVHSEDIRATIYSSVKKLLDTNTQSYDLREVLRFLSKHCSVLAEQMYNDSPAWWNDKLNEWTVKSGENRKAGYVALNAFYTELACVLEKRTEEKDTRIFQYFYKYFLRTMKDDQAQILQVRLAICGFGKFAGPCKVHMSKQELSQMFIIIINRMEQDYFVKEEPSMEQLEYLPDYIQCFSTILHYIGEYTFDQIDSLQQISVLMVKSFPRLSPIYYISVYDSMILTMCYLYQFSSTSLKSYLERVVYQSVLWTCSHRTTFDVDLDQEQGDYKKAFTYRNYLPLWKNLLSFTRNSNKQYNEISRDVQESVSRHLYNELIKTLLVLINKLNLTTKSKYNDNEPIVDPQSAYKAEKIDDFVIFINVVDFYSHILPFAECKYFKPWIEMYNNQIMTKSVKYPLVSGFYKLLRLSLELCEKLKYFDETQLKKEDRQASYQILCSFLENVLFKVQEFKDDLQVSCLQLLLAIPVPFVEPLLPAMGPAFHMVFTIGRGYLKLAETAVDTLEKWYRFVPIEKLKPLFKEILPYLDPFLRSKGYTGDPDIKISLLQSRKTKQSKSKKRVYIESDGELSSLQQKILMFVGQLNSEICMYLVETDGQVESVTWTKEPQLRFTVPYSDVKPSIYLDKIVPRIVELALSSGDQKTRITACELLHATVLYMLGTSRTMSPILSKLLSKLFEKLILPLIQLGCDSHDVIRQLFNPLVFQLVHWYSSPMQLVTSETAILINTLMEGISHPTDTAVRDLSGKCIREFVIWTIKQSQKGDFDKYSVNIKSILHKLCQYCSHPNAFKRLGAALAFNNLYTHLREEASLIDMYWIELLYWLLVNMSLLDVSKRSKTQKNTQIDQSLNHIERVLREQSTLFNKFSKKRRIPAAIKGCLLQDSVLWILQQSGSVNITYRRKCIQLFTSLAPYCNGTGTTKDFITKHVETSEHIWFLKLYEEDGISKIATLNENCTSVDVLMKWLQYLLRCLDAYKFLLDYNIIDNKQLTTDSKIYVSLKYFMDFLSKHNLQECKTLFQNWDKNEVYLPEDIEDFNQIKCLVLTGILDFLLCVLEKDTTCSEEFQNDSYTKFLCNCVFAPNVIGFETTSKENIEKLSVKLIQVLNKYNEKMPASVVDNLCTYFLKYFFDTYDENIQITAVNVPVLQRQLLKGFILVLKSDLREKISKPTLYFSDTVRYISDNIVKESGDKHVGIELQNTIKIYAELKLTLAFEITDQVAILCECLANKETIKIPETSSTMSVGEFFLNSFKDTIMNYIVQHANKIVKNLCLRWKTFSDNSCLQIVMKILKYLMEDKQMKQQTCNSDLTDSIMSCCENVFRSSIEVTLYDRNFQIEFMTRVVSIEDKRTYIIGDRYPFFKTWFIRQLHYDPIDIAPRNMLHFKTNVLSFLQCVTGPDEDSNDALQPALSSFQSKLINQPADQIDNADRIVLFKRLLDYLIMSRSRIVLKSVVDIFTKIKYDDKDINIDRALQSYMKTITVDQQYKSICVVYLLCHNNNYSAECKYKIAKILLLILLRVCKYDAFEQFYEEYIKDIFDNLQLKLEVNSDANMLVNKSVNFMLIEALFSRINVSGFTDKSCRITHAAFNGQVSTGKELLSECINLARLVRKEKLEFTNADLKEYYRLYHCNAFNAIVSIFSNTKKSPDDIKLYCYIFHENKDEFLWKNMIDRTNIISVPQDFDMLPIRKKVFVNIRNENVKKSGTRIRYIESQNLFNSTLSEDICKFDFTNTLIRKVELDNNDSNETVSESLGNIMIECVDVNNHECMASVCGLIRHLIDNGISPLPSNEEDPSLPKWMEMIQKLMLDSSTPINVKIFFARVIHNMKHIFKHYARYFFEPVAKFIIDKCAGNNINYLVADLVEMLVTWSQNIILEDIKEPASQLVQFLMENAHNDRHDMLKYNMEIIKTAVEAWKGIIVVPHDVLRTKISTESKQQLAGINLISIILANNLVPWTNDNVNDLMKDLVDIVQKKNEKVLYRPAAEVVGMFLHEMSSTANYNQEFKLLFESIEEVLNRCTTDKLFHAVEQIQIHYPAIIDKYLQKICFKMYNEKNAALKCICLRNILRRFEHTEFRLLNTKDYISFLGYDDHNLRLLTLQIVHKTVPEMTKPNTKLIVPAVCEHKLDSNGMIRCAVYDVLIAVYKKHIRDNNNESKELVATCKSVLLAGLVDSDLELQEKMQKFWCHEENDSLKLQDRFIKSLTDLYSPDTELFYLGCVNFFLLEACKHTPEYNKLMFEHPLSDCKFDDYRMLINWRARYASMAPMFASNIDTQFGNEETTFPEMIGVRASVSARVFVPTVSVLDVSSSLNPTSSFLFEATPTAGPSTVRSVENVEVPREEQSYKQHSRRFLRDKRKIDLSFAKYEVDKKHKTTELRKELVQWKDANVVMYREYRKGELPDVQIPYSAILKPLQMLARRDGVLARQLYVMLFDGLLCEMTGTTEFIEKFNEGIISVFNQTNMYVPNVIGAFLDIALENNKTRGRPKIYIEPEILSTVCRNSGLLPVGCLLLEDVISSSDAMPSTSKRGCANSNDTVKQWVKLADMYKELNEWDAVIGIFSSKHMECSETVLSAIHAEANGQWREALKDYKQMIETDTNFDRKDFYYDSVFKSYANLSEWESISSYGESFDEKTLWDGDWHQEKMLPWYITSQVCVTLEGNTTATILDNLEKWMKSKDKSDYLKDKFSEELAMLALYKNDINASHHYVQNSISKFLEDWSHLNPLFPKIRSSRLLNFQKVIDLNKYVSCTDNNFDDLLNYWQENSDFNCPSVYISEIRTLYRQQILTSYEQKITQLNLDDVDEQKLLIKDLKLASDINLISSSLERNNHFVARKYCRKHGSYMKSNVGVVGFKLSIAAGKIGTVVAEMFDGSEKVSKLIKTWKSLDTVFKRCTYPDLQIESAHQIYVITQNIFSVLKDNTDLISKHREDLAALTGDDVSTAVDVQIYGTRKLGSTVENQVEQYTGNAKVVNNIIKAYLSLIVFAQNHENSEEYSADIAKYVLRGMKLGSKEARQLFPCLLQMSANEITETFKSESSTVPTWMFLAWIPQILATLDTSIAHATAHVVKRIATTYPQALVYAYRLSREKYNLQDGSAFFKDLINELDELLRNELIDKFIAELSCVCIPQLYFNYHVEKIIQQANSYKSAKEKIANFIDDFKAKIKSSEHFNIIDSSVKQLSDIINRCSNWDDIKKYLIRLRTENADEVKKIKDRQYTKLNTCSVWLANYQASSQHLELEIPGQYTGERKPILKYHAKISSFHSDITCISSSLRKPIKITIFGNDSREYPFLVKFGEDLRQDQRIQQLLSLANNILYCDLQCRQRNLSVERFEVTPLTTSLGLIKWVDDTTSLSTFIYDSVEVQDKLNQFLDIRAQYHKWIMQASKGAECPVHVYFWNALTSYSQNDTVQKFTSFVNEIPANVLSKAFWHISMDTESYTALRHQFITSYASMCLVHWLFGIGDRNLGNCLILKNTGRAVGIDFGLTFGAGTQNLPIPELIPFRLTPHILHMMDPLRETGFIEHTMIHCLRALRKQKHIVASTMSVFINEPSVDWLEYARRQQNTGEQSSGSWYPNRKVSLARRKLDGANPAAITVEELKDGCIRDSNVMRAYMQLVKGDESNLRAQMAQEDLTEEQQVKCLLDQATDYNILGRMYYGLELWI